MSEPDPPAPPPVRRVTAGPPVRTAWDRTAGTPALEAHDGDPHAHPDLRAALAALGGPAAGVELVTRAQLIEHLDDPVPHPAYDDMPSLALRFLNRLV